MMGYPSTRNDMGPIYNESMYGGRSAPVVLNYQTEDWVTKQKNRELVEQNLNLRADVQGLELLRDALKSALAEVAPDHPLAPTSMGSADRRQAIFEKGWYAFMNAEEKKEAQAQASVQQVQNRQSAVDHSATHAQAHQPVANPLR